MALKTAIIDDGSVAFRGVAGILESAREMSFLGTFSGLDSADLPLGTVVIADPFCDPRGRSIDVPEGITMLVMSGSTLSDDVQEALRCGARGYIGKSADVSTLITAITAAYAGDYYIAGNVAAALTPAAPPIALVPPPAHRPADHQLTPREQEVVVLVARGYTHKQIGTRLGLTKATVDTYVHRVRQKVGSANKAGLTRKAIELQLLCPSEQEGVGA